MVVIALPSIFFWNGPFILLIVMLKNRSLDGLIQSSRYPTVLIDREDDVSPELISHCAAHDYDYMLL